MKKQPQNGPDIVTLITKLQEQLAALDKKVDLLINKPLPQPVAASQQPRPSSQAPAPAQQNNDRQNDRNKPRQMYKATCAECKNDCEIPFKPAGDRPVFCKECFMRRKAVRVMVDDKPKAAAPLPAVVSAAPDIQHLTVKAKKKPAPAKKPAAKKPAPKKKK